MITTRQEAILNIIVSDYIKIANPIASDQIVAHYDLGVSSATIRNDVAELEEAGYLSRPHSSAGAIPLDKAYRFYVESMDIGIMPSVPQHIQSYVKRRLLQSERDIEQRVKFAANMLSDLVGNVAISTYPQAKVSTIRHLEVIPLHEFVAMIIVVLGQTKLKRQIIRFDEPIDRTQIEFSSNKIREAALGLTSKGINYQMPTLNALENSLLEIVLSILKAEDEDQYKDGYIHGLGNILSQPEFSQNSKLQAFLEGLETGAVVQTIVEETPIGEVVRVIIGRENRDDVLQHFGIVISQYGIPNEIVGTISAIGPTRMEYFKAIGSVKFISSVMTDLVEDVLAV